MKLITVIMLLLLMPAAEAQKIMRLDSNLKANSEMLSVKTKAAIVVGNIFKYSFGPYEVISTKTGWSSGSSRKKMFSKIEKTESKQKSSFIMTTGGKDTITTSLSLNILSEYVWERYLTIQKKQLSIEEESDLKSSNKNVIAIIAASGDTAEWNMMFVSRMNPDSSFREKKYGVLTDGKTTIEIGEITEWEKEKDRKWHLTKGFDFFKEGEALAAVQTPIDSFQKKYVWMKNDLDKKIKNVLAAAVVVLMSYNFM